MGDFDKKIIIDFFKKENEKAELNLQSHSNDVFGRGEDLALAYGNVKDRLEKHYNSLTDDQKKTAYYNTNVLNLGLRKRLAYFLVLEELMVDKKITLDDLADTSSPEAVARKRQVGDKVFDFFTNPKNTKEKMGERVVAANKRFRDMIEAYNNQLLDTVYKEDKDAYFKKVSELHSLLDVHFEGHNETGKVGVSDKDYDKDAGLSILLSHLTVLNEDIKKEVWHSTNVQEDDKRQTLLKHQAYERQLPLNYFIAIKQKQLSMDIIASGEYHDPHYNGNVQAAILNNALKTYLGMSLKKGFIGALTEEECNKMVVTPALINKIEAHYTPADMLEPGTVTLTYNGMTIFNSADRGEPNPRDVAKFKRTVNREFDNMVKEKFKAADSQRLFDRKDAKKEFVKDFIDALAEYKQQLEKNTWGRYGRSSANYRSMQDEIDSMIDRFKDVNPEKDKVIYSKFKFEYERMMKSIETYVEGKGGFGERNYDGEYEEKRVEAAKDAFYRFEKFKLGMQSLEDWQKERDNYKDLKEQVKTRFEGINSKNSRGFVSQDLIDSAKKSANNLAELYSKYTKPLTDEEKHQMQTDFDKLCELSARRLLLQNAGDSRAKAVAALTTEQIMEVVRSSDSYKTYFDHPEDLTAKSARNLLEANHDKKIVCKESIANKLIKMADDKMVELKLDADPDLKKINESKMYTSKEVANLFKDAVSDFGKNKNVASYAKAITYERVSLTLDKNKETMSGKDIFDMVLANKKAYDVLASKDANFNEAVSDGDFYGCQRAMNKAVEAMSKKQKEKAIAKENVVQKEQPKMP